MYYDPMISKLVTWGEDRDTAMNLLDKAIDDYVIQGLSHNLGFCKSILSNQSFRDGDYSTAFIPEFYPNGYDGVPLCDADKSVVAKAAFLLKSDAL